MNQIIAEEAIVKYVMAMVKSIICYSTKQVEI